MSTTQDNASSSGGAVQGKENQEKRAGKKANILPLKNGYSNIWLDRQVASPGERKVFP